MKDELRAVACEKLTRREVLEALGAVVMIAQRQVQAAIDSGGKLSAQEPRLNAVAGPDRIVMHQGRTYLNGWGGYGEPPRRIRGRRGEAPPAPPPDPGPAPSMTWNRVSGPGTVTFADANSAVTTASFSALGTYVLQVTADNGQTKSSSSVTVTVEPPPPSTALTPVVTKHHTITSPLWSARTKALIVSWIPHCIDQMNRSDLTLGPGGMDNFIEAAKALRGEPHGTHKGYVFSNAWIHQTVEAMSLALMVEPQGDRDIIEAQAKMKATLEDWIPKILAAQHLDGYLHTAFTLRNKERWPDRWSVQGRGNHEGYVAGYFIESAINHYTMTDGKDIRLYNAAKKLADCWADHIGPAPKQEWFDGHQEMEQALVRFGRFVNETEGGNKGQRYIDLAKFLLDCRKGGSEYDQSHLPVVQQYEAVGHAVRAVYSYSAMADVAVETHDVDYQSAVKSLWDNLVHRKLYVTGGVGSGETSEGFGAELFAAEQFVLRDLFELRHDLLPVEDAPRLPGRPLRRSLRADDVQRPHRRYGPRRGRTSITTTRSTRTSHAIPGTPARAASGTSRGRADAADLDVLRRDRTASTSTCLPEAGSRSTALPVRTSKSSRPLTTRGTAR